MDMAVGVVLGVAFAAIVTSLVNDIISPIIGAFVRVDFTNLVLSISGVDIRYGAFIMAILNFLIIAFTVFMMVKSVNKLASLNKKQTEESPTTKICQFCKSEIDIEATKCPHCTSSLEE